MPNLRGFTVRAYGPRTISAEVDRQLGMMGEVEMPLVWWDSSTGTGTASGTIASQSDSSVRVGCRRKLADADEDIEMNVLSYDSDYDG